MSTNPRPPLAMAVSFLAYLQRRCRDDRGALASLRGALSEARRPHAWPLLAGFNHAIGHPAYETVADLGASSERQTQTGCLADTCRVLAGTYDGKTGRFAHDSFQSRFKRMLTCDRSEIADHIAPVVRAAQAKDVPVNYTH